MSCFMQQKIILNDHFSPWILFVHYVCVFVCFCSILPQMIYGKDKLNTVFAKSRWYQSEAGIIDQDIE